MLKPQVSINALKHFYIAAHINKSHHYIMWCFDKNMYFDLWLFIYFLQKNESIFCSSVLTLPIFYPLFSLQNVSSPFLSFINIRLIAFDIKGKWKFMMSLTSEANVSLRQHQLFCFSTTHGISFKSKAPFLLWKANEWYWQNSGTWSFARVKFSVQNDDTERRQISKAYSFV